ncbi:MAG: ATP-binding cassette domain-containing protein [Acetomicrobium sp.]
MTENRKEEGLVLYEHPENITLPILNSLAKSPLKIIDKNKQIEISNEYFNRLNIKAPSLERPVNELSGGNQQKVVLAKWLATNSKILIFDEPTRGIDVGAKVEIYELMNELIKQGCYFNGFVRNARNNRHER